MGASASSQENIEGIRDFIIKSALLAVQNRLGARQQKVLDDFQADMILFETECTANQELLRGEKFLQNDIPRSFFSIKQIRYLVLSLENALLQSGIEKELRTLILEDFEKALLKGPDKETKLIPYCNINRDPVIEDLQDRGKNYNCDNNIDSQKIQIATDRDLINAFKIAAISLLKIDSEMFPDSSDTNNLRIKDIQEWKATGTITMDDALRAKNNVTLINQIHRHRQKYP